MKNPAIEKRIAAALKRLTLREKIGQMCQAHGDSKENEALARQGRIGSLLNVADVDRANAYQQLAVRESRAGIPLLLGRDVIHGFRTVFPIPLGQAAAWNPALVEEAAAVAAREASACGIRWTFAPMVDVARDPRWGRIAEGGGEDPYLAGQLGAAMVRGFQGVLPGQPDRIAACAKHYVAYGAAEGGRDYNTADVSLSTLRDVYLPPFRACVDAGTATLMSAFNEINGVPASGNAFTLRQVLRREWGFDGFVVSDWGSVEEMIKHGAAADRREAALASALAGLDMEMVSPCYAANLEKLVRLGRLPVRVIDTAVANILRVKFRLGLFEQWSTDPGRRQVLLAPAHLETARALARQSLVLLQNRGGLLPLAKDAGAIAVLGPLAEAPAEQLGCWAFDGKAEDCQTPLAAIRTVVGATGTVRYAAGLPDARATDRAGIAAAVEAARQSKVALLFVGEPAILSGEAHSRAFLDLPGAQQALVDAITATGVPTVVVVLAGRPLTIRPVLDAAAAVVYAWHPGTMAGPAIADILFGHDAPSGKLPVSLPRTVGQIPIHYNHKPTGRPPIPTERQVPMGTPLDPVGFCSNYLDVEHTPEFPFGFGLSYTQFAYGPVTVRPGTVKRGATVRVTATVTNTGRRAAEEIVQLYVRDLVGSVTRPVRELKGFMRVALQPGEKRTVEFLLATDSLAFTNAAGQRVVEPGEFQAWIAPDAARGEPATFAVR